VKVALILLLLMQAAEKGVVTGRVRAADGSPAAGVRVAAMAVPENGGPTDGSVLESITQTDASGSYRLENVSPGRYYIITGLVEMPTYFPGVNQRAAAKIVDVGTRSTVTNIDFSIVTPLSVKVSGRLVGTVATRAPMVLLPQGGSVRVINTTVNDDGTFEFLNVTPGTYGIHLLGIPLPLRPTPTVVVGDRDATGVEFVVPTVGPVRFSGMESVWAIDGSWLGVVADEKGGSFYAGSVTSRALVELDASGKVLRQISATPSPILRQARFAGTDRSVFLAFGTWSANVRAIDVNGSVIWTYPEAGSTATGIDDVWPADLDGDGSDEVIVGFNGGTGLHVIDGKGQLRWKSTGIGNVWHVSAGQILVDGKPNIVTTSASGKVHVFSFDGSSRKDLEPGLYGNMVRVGRASPNDSLETIFAMGSTPAGTSITAMTGDGVQKWSLDLPGGRTNIYSSVPAPGKAWLAIGTQSGQVFVVNTERGTVIATLDGEGSSLDVAWTKASQDSDPLLVVSSRTKLNAFRITQENAK